MSVDDPNLEHLLARASLVEERVRRLVAARRQVDPHPDDAFRGLYVSDELVDRLASGPVPDDVVLGDEAATVEKWAAEIEADGSVLRLRRLARSAELTDLDVELLLVALLPDLDARFERIYGYLNDDVTRRRASVGLALTLVGESTLSAPARGRLESSRPLLRHRLIELEDADRPLLSRGVRVPDRVVAHLLGDDAPDPSIADLLTAEVSYACPVAAQLAAALLSGHRVVYVREHGGALAASVGMAGLERAGLPTTHADLSRLPDGADVVGLLTVAVREALLAGGGLLAGPINDLAQRPPELLRVLTGAHVPVVLVGHPTWNPEWAETTPVILTAPDLSAAERLSVWHQELGADGVAIDLEQVAAQLALGPTQIRRAVQAAAGAARLHGTAISTAHLRAGVRAQNAAGLERLARRIEPEVTWDDLIVTDEVLAALKDVASRARHRRTVLKDWGMRRGGGRGCGVTALFSGDSGTGKTMAAEVIAADLQLDLYTVNLATVVDKYVGETEKNLELIFTEASGVNAVLFFDEADAIFGKRSEVRDAHDRFANIESAYLLQRLESFDGLAILASNLRTNIDEAFTRRLDSIITFAQPDFALRQALWRRSLAGSQPARGELDVDYLASRFDLAGGHISSAATTACYAAASRDEPLTTEAAVIATEHEYRKMGLLMTDR